MNRHRPSRFSPLVMALCVVVGIVIGTFYANHFSGNRLSIINTGSNKLGNLLHIIDDQYVDTVNINDLVEGAMPQILAELDPHSVYISAKDVQAANDELKGSFFGIGIEFVIQDDTISVQNVIGGGPSERAGIVAGDKIVAVDGKPFVGPKITSDEARRKLKGKKGTKVVVGVKRTGEKKLRTFSLIRAEIPQKSICATYMLDEETGYIKVKSFGESTYPELLIALAQLSQSNVKNLIIDLRGNSGGYLEASVQMVNEFLPKNQLIVYTKGRKSPRHDFKSDGRGSYQHIPLTVLIDETSASAAEIFAGAIQDNDRGTLIGRRSFGKGLVQQPITFRDNSMMRLTVARYYTPSGRCIQKPYTSGSDKEYSDDLATRFEHGEYFSSDSIKHQGPAYHTRKGRTVYGGGGITPDIFVGEDTTGVTSYYKEAVMSGLIFQFAFEYVNSNRAQLSSQDSLDELVEWIDKQNVVEKFVQFADKKGLRRRNLMVARSRKLLKTMITSRIIYGISHEDALVEYSNRTDPTVLTAVEKFKTKKK